MRYHTRIEGVRYPIESLLAIKDEDIELVLSPRFIEEAGIPRSLVEERVLSESDIDLSIDTLLSSGQGDGDPAILFTSVAEAPEVADALRSALGLASRQDGTIPLFAKKG